jgi:hypothetical protein
MRRREDLVLRAKRLADALPSLDDPLAQIVLRSLIAAFEDAAADADGRPTSASDAIDPSPGAEGTGEGQHGADNRATKISHYGPSSVSLPPFRHFLR